MARQRPWTRANVIVAGTPSIPHDRTTKWSSPELAVDLLGCLLRPATAPEGFGACQERTGEKWLTDESHSDLLGGNQSRVVAGSPYRYELGCPVRNDSMRAAKRVASWNRNPCPASG